MLLENMLFTSVIHLYIMLSLTMHMRVHLCTQSKSKHALFEPANECEHRRCMRCHRRELESLRRVVAGVSEADGLERSDDEGSDINMDVVEAEIARRKEQW